MSADRETTRIVRSWLEEGVTALPDAVLDEVLDAIPTTPQRRATWWPVRRLTTMNATLKFGLAAVVVVAAALLGFNYLMAPNVGAPGLGDPTPTPTPTASAVAMLGTGTLDAGTYRANPFVPVEVLVTVPDGWSAQGDWLLIGPGGVEPPDGMNIRFGSVTHVSANPFDLADGFVDLPNRASVQELTDAMANHPEWPTSPATDVTIDGYAGTLFRVTLAPDLEMPADGRYLLFVDGGGGDRWAFEPGQIIDIYVIDVEGHAVVLELFSYPDTPEDDIAARQRVIDSIQLEP